MNIKLKDGTVINVRVVDDGIITDFVPSEPIDKSIFTDENLSEVYYDGENMGRMVLDAINDAGTMFFLREPTKQELQINEVQSQIQEVVSEPTFTTISASQSGISVPANRRANTQIALPNIPEGFFFGAFREVSLSGTGFENCAIQFFGSTSNGTKANIGIKNFSNSDVTINVNVTVLFMKDFSQNNVR